MSVVKHLYLYIREVIHTTTIVHIKLLKTVWTLTKGRLPRFNISSDAHKAKSLIVAYLYVFEMSALTKFFVKSTESKSWVYVIYEIGITYFSVVIVAIVMAVTSGVLSAAIAGIDQSNRQYHFNGWAHSISQSLYVLAQGYLLWSFTPYLIEYELEVVLLILLATYLRLIFRWIRVQYY
ncbi:hypothetical protein VIBNIFTn2_120104 [Vibrio nigripulchritudo FTn2]|uniref:hypothetical protein n=1 Tax=Vibrio nigripulchritudo TaxID=28173 RepID=UPI0003B1E7CB|nr:hypothetical protein [Vibrio nigripulchritudo]CCN40122.1 hypothetical protein VIBNIFTn2_120104 [Vibrio nigripulchritudo FTn2]